MYKSMFRPEVIRRVELCFFRPCKTSIRASDVRNPPRGYPYWTLNFCLYKPCAMCLSLLHFQPCAGSEPDCNCCLSNKYTYMQLRSPEVTRVNFHLSYLGARDRDSNNLNGSPRWANHQDLNHTEEYETLFFKRPPNWIGRRPGPASGESREWRKIIGL